MSLYMRINEGNEIANIDERKNKRRINKKKEEITTNEKTEKYMRRRRKKGGALFAPSTNTIDGHSMDIKGTFYSQVT